MILLSQVTFLKFILFADDTTIIAPINTNYMETANILNVDEKYDVKLNTYCFLNISKTTFLRQNDYCDGLYCVLFKIYHVLH